MDNKVCICNLLGLSLEELKKEIKNKFNYKWFTKYYIYNIDGLSTMIYYTLRNPNIMNFLLQKTDNNDYFGINSIFGLEMSNHISVNDFGHTGLSMNQTIFITQQIIKKGINNTITFYKNFNTLQPF